MRTVRRALIAAAIVALPLALGSTAVGQSEAPLDPMGADFWTGTWTETGGAPGVDTSHADYTESLGRIARGEATADDPRMVGTWTLVTNVHFAAQPRAGRGGYRHRERGRHGSTTTRAPGSGHSPTTAASRAATSCT